MHVLSLVLLPYTYLSLGSHRLIIPGVSQHKQSHAENNAGEMGECLLRVQESHCLFRFLNFFFIYLLCVFACLYTCMYRNVTVVVRGELEGIGSLLASCGSHILNSGPKVWQQSPFTTELSHWSWGSFIY